MAEPDAIDEIKRVVGRAIAKRLEGFRQWDVAVLLRVDQPRVSDLVHGRLRRFSLETLIRFADRLGLSVELTTRQRQHGWSRRE